MDKKQVSAWALFDFANSVYPAVMTTAVFPLFFVGVVVGNDAGQGDWWYGRAISLSALIVATSAPLLGAIADRGGARKKLMLLYVGLCLVGVAMMSSLEAGMVVQGFVLFVVANVGLRELADLLQRLPSRHRSSREAGVGIGSRFRRRLPRLCDRTHDGHSLRRRPVGGRMGSW